jgi:uncharacterized protein YjbI with pentapeptide repeats
VRQAASAKPREIGTRLREHRAVVVLAVTVATLLVLAVVILPPLLAGGDDTENDVRSTLLQGLAGLVLAAGLYFTAQTLRHNRESAARTYELEREGQITERFTRAIDQLGDEKLDVRLGGIYALERIAKGSPDDHGPIMEVLTAYVREHAPLPPHLAEDPEEAVSAEDREPEEPGTLATDVQAVIAVLGRRELSGREEQYRLDLSSADLRGAKFGKRSGEGRFEQAIFERAHLDGADLGEVSLAGANLTRASLRGTDLVGANLTDASLEWANLTIAKLRSANLTGANLERASLRTAFLMEANLTEAFLMQANLNGVNLEGANLTGANLSGTDLAEAYFMRANVTDADLAAADLGGANLTQANLTGADLTDANLTGAHLFLADLTGANLDGANLTAAYLVQANLTEAILEGANLTGANLEHADLTNAVYDSGTKWPAGFDPKAEGARLHEE